MGELYQYIKKVNLMVCREVTDISSLIEGYQPVKGTTPRFGPDGHKTVPHTKRMCRKVE